jgi:hypothetical protein
MVVTEVTCHCQQWIASVANPVGKVGLIRRRIVKSTELAIQPSLWETVAMATKRTKTDKAQRQSDQLEKKSERRPQQGTNKKTVRKDFSRAA